MANITELRLPDLEWRKLKHALGLDMIHYQHIDYERPNFIIDTQNVCIVVIKASDGPPQWKGVHAPYKCDWCKDSKHMHSANGIVDCPKCSEVME